MYLKWLRYYLDFCDKYVIVLNQVERLHLFQQKLKQKRQSEKQCETAAHAVALFFALEGPQKEHGPVSKAEEITSFTVVHPTFAGQRTVIFQLPSHYSVAGYQEKSDSPEWDEMISKLADEIKVRHYFRKTLKTYAHWSRQFQRFLRNKPPADLVTEDVKEYLT